MEKVVTSIKYFEGLKYFENVFRHLFEVKNDKLEIDAECIRYARLAFLNNIFFETKEKTVQNNISKIYIEELEKTVLVIAQKFENNFILDNKIFNTAEEVVTFVRNSIAHGRYFLDESLEKVILNDDKDSVIINFDDLTNFVIELFQKRLIFPLGNALKKTAVYYIGGRKNSLKTEEDIKEVLDDMVFFGISLHSDKQISKETYEIFNETFQKLTSKPNLNFIMPSNENFKIKQEVVPFCLLDNKKLIHFLNNVLNKNDSFENQLLMIEEEARKCIDPEFSLNDMVGANIVNINLLLLLEYEKPQSIYNLIENLNKEDMLKLSYNNYVVTALAMFNCLFSYNFDGLFRNKCENEFVGFDYSLFDFEKFEIKKFKMKWKERANNDVNIIKNQIKELENSKKRIIRKINILNGNKNKTNEKGIKELESAIALAENEILNIEKDIISLKEKQFLKSTLYFENMESIVNESIIEGIRNSIAHGNYKIEFGNDFEDIKIIFSDIFEEKNTFEASIKMIDFLNFLSDSEMIILERMNAYVRKL